MQILQMIAHASGGWPFKRLNPSSLPELLDCFPLNASGTNQSSRPFDLHWRSLWLWGSLWVWDTWYAAKFDHWQDSTDSTCAERWSLSSMGDLEFFWARCVGTVDITNIHCTQKKWKLQRKRPECFESFTFLWLFFLLEKMNHQFWLLGFSSIFFETLCHCSYKKYWWPKKTQWKSHHSNSGGHRSPSSSSWAGSEAGQREDGPWRPWRCAAWCLGTTGSLQDLNSDVG